MLFLRERTTFSGWQSWRDYSSAATPLVLGEVAAVLHGRQIPGFAARDAGVG